MSNDIDDTGMIEALLQRPNDFRLPRQLELKEPVKAVPGLNGSAGCQGSLVEFGE